MKKFLIALLGVCASVLVSNATILFPHFVDIAPDYHEGNIMSLEAAGIMDVGLSSTTTSYYPKTFEQAVSFYKDALPSDVKVEESKVGNLRLRIYTSITRHDGDVIKTSGYLSKIYLLEQPDGSYHSGYFEKEIPEDE